LFGDACGDFPLLAFDPGERARFDVSFIQFLNDAKWFMKGGWYFLRRLGTKPFGESRSGLLDTTCNILLLDLLRSISFGGGVGRDNEPEPRTRSFSTGGGGCSVSGLGIDPDSGS
jgi:hypothetical protein